MSTVQADLGPLSRSAGAGLSFPNAFMNLFSKELRESAGPIITGICAFWLMPVFVAMMALLFGPGREEAWQIFGALVYVSLVAGGWLFAAGLGAIVVCRDWGRSEEHFLLAQPVTPRWIVTAKLAAAITVVGLIVLTLLGIVHLLMLYGIEARQREDLSFPDALVLCLVGVSLSLSFSIAVITRQSTASLVLTMLIMALGVAAPLVSTRFSFLHPNWDLLEDLARKRVPGRGTSWPDWWGAYGTFLVSLAVCTIGSLSAAFTLCTRERVIRIGHKPLAWTVASAALLLFAAGMMEVGRSVEICDRVTLCRPVLGHSYEVVHYERGGGYAVACWERVHLHAATFSVGSDGRLGSLRSSDVPLSPVRLSEGSGVEVLPALSWIKEVTYNGPTILTVVGGVSDRRLLGSFGLARIQLHWDEKAGFRPVSTAIAGEVAGPKAAGNGWCVCSSLSTERYAYLLYEEEPEQKPDGLEPEDLSLRPRRLILRVYDWSTGPRPARVLEIPIPFRCWLHRADSRIVFYDSRSASLLGAVPSDDPQAVKSLFARGVPKPHPLSERERANARARLSLLRSRGTWDRELSIDQNKVPYEVKADSKGLVVERVKKGQVFEPVRAYRYPPLARMVMSGGAALKAVDSTLLAEEGARSIIFYDMSDPFRMRRVGFYNTPGEFRAQVEDADGYILVLEEGELTVLKRPKTARPGLPESSEEAAAADAAAGG